MSHAPSVVVVGNRVESTVTALEAAGFEPDAVFTPYEAFHACAVKSRVAVVLCLDGASEPELQLARVLSRSPETARLARVAVAAPSARGVALEALGDTLDDVLWEEAPRDELIARLTRLRRRLADAASAGPGDDDLADLRVRCLRLIAHDLNNALTAIRILGEMLVQELPEASESRQDLEDVLEAADLSSAIIESMSHVVRLEAEPEPATTFPIDVADVLREVAGRGSFRKLARLRVSVAGLTLDGDRNALRQAVLDAMLNARRMSDGKGPIEVELDGDERRLEVRVVVPVTWEAPAGLEGLMDLYGAVGLRADRVPVSATGLAWASHVTRAHGGSVEVRAEPGSATIVLSFAR